MKLSTVFVIAFAYFVLPATAIGVSIMVISSLLMIVLDITDKRKDLE